MQLVQKLNDYRLRKTAKMLKQLFLVIILVISSFWSFSQIYCGHSHNDYLQKKPLFEALKYGYKSIEIDVWLHQNKLVVSHVKLGLNKKPTIDALYLTPLIESIKKNRGKIYDKDSIPVTLMVELKNQRETAYTRLKEYIEPYKKYFCQWQGDSLIHKGVLTLLITGGAPHNTILADSIRIATVDGGIGDTVQSVSSILVPRISEPWNKYFIWNGAGKMPKEEQKTLNKLVAAVHKSGKTLRFYGAPDNYGVWKQLLNSGVDWINTNELKPFAEYYKGRK